MIPLLYNSTASFVSLAGMSGELWVDPDGRVRRRLPIAQFRNGRPATLTPAADEAVPGEEQILSQR